WARFIGSAEERVAGSSTSSNSSIARTAPIPPSVIVSPTSACRSAALRAVVLGSVATVVWEAAHSSARLTASRSSPQTGEGCGAAAGHRRRRRRHGARGMRRRDGRGDARRSEEHTSELQSRFDLVCRLLLEKKKNIHY